MKKKKTSAGFTLLEAVIALAVWMILSLSVFFVWQYTAERSNALIERQNAFENARMAMDGLIMNIQMAKEIQLLKWPNSDILRRLTVTQLYTSRDGNQRIHNYDFTFFINTTPTGNPTRHHRLIFGTQEFASNIRTVWIIPINDNQTMHITIETGCEYPIFLEGSVDIRYKRLTIRS